MVPINRGFVRSAYMRKTGQEIFAIETGESDYMDHLSFCAIIFLIITDKTDFI